MSLESPRVLLLPSSYMDRNRVVGGGERYALELARALAERTPATLGLFHREPARQMDGCLTVRHFGVRNYEDHRILFPATAATWRELGSSTSFICCVSRRTFPTCWCPWPGHAGNWWS